MLNPPVSSKSCSIAVLFLVGGYPSETYSSERINWLERSLQDLCNQSLTPSEVLVSLNATVSHNEFVFNLVHKYLPKAKILNYSFNRSGLLNFETLLQFANSDYICFWSDHDIHSANFLSESIHHIQKNSAVLSCPIINYVYESGEPYLPCPQSLEPLNTVIMSKSESFKKVLASDIKGAIYGVWSKKIFKNINIIGHENIDILCVYAAALQGNMVFFESRSSLLVLRHKVAKVNNHDSLLPSEIMDPVDYNATRHFRFFKVLRKIINDSSDDENTESSLLCIARSAFSSRNNCYGSRYPGVRFLVRSFVLCLRWRLDIRTFMLQLAYFANKSI